MELTEDILDNAKWFYIAYRPYETFYILITQNGPNSWTLYYLDKQGESAQQLADVSGLGDISVFTESKSEQKPCSKRLEEHVLHMETPAEYSNVDVNYIFRQIEKKSSKRIDVNRDISGCVVVRKMNGNLGAIIHEFKKIVR